MLPIGPLMIEHRLIEKLIALLKKEGEFMEREKTVNPQRIMTAVDFIMTYGDRCHHGKEEELLFRELDRKSLTGEHHHILQELRDEHRRSRALTAELGAALDDYLQGKKEAIHRMSDTIRLIGELYRNHIGKEDRKFFLPVMDYFSSEEQASLLAQEQEFDRNLLHELYREKVEKEVKDFEEKIRKQRVA
jgi:hemerythrin-like domain-containing protein